MTKKSIPYWLKKHSSWGGPYTAIVEAVKLHAEQGDHPEIEFKGSSMELATVLYLEHAKKAGAAGGLYCTLPEVADRMVASLELKPGWSILNPGSGLHALTRAVRTAAPEVMVTCIECQDWLVQLCDAAGWPVIPGDLENAGLLGMTFQAVIANPSWGKLWGSGNYERVAMSRIAALTRPGVRVAVLLPGEEGQFFEKLPNSFAPLRNLYEVVTANFYPSGVSLPKSIPGTRYLLERL